MRYISVCSGVEAASQAWEPLGWKPVAFSEIEPFPCAVLASRFPDVPNLGDMSKIHYDRKTKELYNDTTRLVCDGGIDLLVGGTPCQSFSVAGKRAGLEGASGLAYHYARLLGEIQPRWFVWENVPGAISSVTYGDQRDFNFLLQQFAVGGDASLGVRWDLCWRVLDTQYVRVERFARAIPQRRRRVFVVGRIAGGDGGGCEVLLEREGVLGHSAPRRVKGQGTAGDTAARAGGADCESYGINPQNGSQMTPCTKEVEQTNTVAHFNGVAISFKGGQSADGGLGVDEGACQNRQAVCIRTANTHANGCGIADDVTHTLDGANGQAVAYKLDATESNSMKSANPNSGIHKTDVHCTLDTTDPNPTKAQGGVVIVAPKTICFQQNQRCEVRDLGGAAGALQSEPGMKQQNFLAIGIDQQGGKGMCGFANERMPTICSDSHGTPHAVAIGIGRDAFNSGANAQMSQSISREVQPPFTAKVPGGGVCVSGAPQKERT